MHHTARLTAAVNALAAAAEDCRRPQAGDLLRALNAYVALPLVIRLRRVEANAHNVAMWSKDPATVSAARRVRLAVAAATREVVAA